LRAVRLATKLGFEIEPRTQTLIQNAASSLVSVSAERVRDELVKILSSAGGNTPRDDGAQRADSDRPSSLGCV
jgi:tRNA nucleotidyltransferase/poly(A) polymerase